MASTNLGKIADIITGPFGSMLHKSDYKEVGTPVIMPQDIGDRTLSLESIARIGNEDVARLARYATIENDIVYARRGDVEKHAYITNEQAGALCGTGCLRVRVNEQLADPLFVSFYLNRPESRTWIRLHAVGSNMPNINTDILSELPLELPELDTQRQVGNLLRCIDNTIANNKKLMMELESTARLIYDYWFTQFDFPDENGRPYRSSGGKMVWSNELKCEIPNGWKVVNLYGIADYINGLACQNHRPKGADKGLPVIKIREMHDGITEGTERVSSQIPARNIIEDGDMLFAWSASLEVQYWNGGTAGLNQHIFKVIPKVGIPSEYVYQQLAQYLVIFKRMAEVRKTTMGHITSDHLDQSRIVLPPQDVLQMFDDATRDVRKSIVQLGQQIRELILLRDWLLPMLMNGQITIEG